MKILNKLLAPTRLIALQSLDGYSSELQRPYDIKTTFKPAAGAARALVVGSIDPNDLGVPALVYNQHISANGFYYSAVGISKLDLSIRYIPINGINSLAFGSQSKVENFFKQIYPNGLYKTLIGEPLVYNLTQYQPVKGVYSQEFGKPYLQGGVRWLDADRKGIDSLSFGKLDTLNTTANQYTKPRSINNQDVGRPDVSPRMVQPNGLSALLISMPDIRDPAVKPQGLVHSSYGNQTVWFHTRYLVPKGILSYESGYPLVADLAQFIQASSLTTSAIFGDTYAKNTLAVIKPPSVFEGAFSDYSTAVNRDRVVASDGLLSQSIGLTNIRNKSPALYTEGVNSLQMGGTGIGYRFRSVGPTGFDKLLLGIATLTKTPEVFPRGYDVALYGKTVISNAIRYIRPDGKEQSLYSISSTVWFRYRYIAPRSWTSHKLSSPVLTHGVREVIGIGSTHDSYGLAWISQSSRLLAPKSIYEIKQSNHMVGRSQEIKPYGYIATLFGTRIVPESSGIYAQGFAGSFGLNSIELLTRYLSPVGYISVGQAPADRWGNATAYNQVQYIMQEFDINGDLVPPKWSDWTLIENRNKQLRATGLNSLRFGYSQIDNNASPLLPKGIEPPVGKNNMISHAVRFIVLDGIEPQIMSPWGVIFNAARPIAPQGYINTSAGTSAVVNTRRYYNNVGRLDSLETGTPMIAYRIRTIDIEPRYSIEPPQINLPTVDLYTRYIGFNGYETAAYGTPSLTIHFNIISPKWVYKETSGSPALHNVTPEYFVYGHDSSEFGITSLRTQWRDVYTIGDDASLFGLTRISDTKQVIEVRGTLSSIASQQHLVTKTGTNPYVLQHIWLINESKPGKDGYGIPPPKEQVSIASLNQNVLYQQGHQSSKFGFTKIHSNNITINGIGIGPFGEGATVYNKQQAVSLTGYGIASTKIELGKPRLSPHTIWAVVDAPKQAQQNHQSSNLHRINSMAVFGKVSLESTIRTINHRSGGAGSVFGRHYLDLSRKIVSSSGFRLSRFGIPAIPFTPQEVKLREGLSESNWGFTVVERPPYTGPRYINTSGFDSLAYGQVYSDNLIRTLKAKGSEALLMGKPKENDNPFMWQGLRIGAHIPFIAGGDGMLKFGDTAVTLRVREVVAKGFDAFRSEYQLEKFRERVTVVNLDKQLPSTGNITVAGINSNNYFGVTDLKYGQNFIRPDGNSDQFRKGGHHA